MLFMLCYLSWSVVSSTYDDEYDDDDDDDDDVYILYAYQYPSIPMSIYMPSAFIISYIRYSSTCCKFTLKYQQEQEEELSSSSLVLVHFIVPNFSYREPIEEIHSCCFHRSPFSLHTYRVYLSTHIYTFILSIISIHLLLYLSPKYMVIIHISSINHIIMYLSNCVPSSSTN